MGYDIDQKVPIPGLEVDEDDGRWMLSFVMGGDGLGGMIIETRVYAAEEVFQAARGQQKRRSRQDAPAEGRGDGTATYATFLGTVDN